jgi:hypothetical protein
MRISTALASVVVILAAGTNSASAADQFAAMTGIKAQPMSQQEMRAVIGSATLKLTVKTPHRPLMVIVQPVGRPASHDPFGPSPLLANAHIDVMVSLNFTD